MRIPLILVLLSGVLFTAQTSSAQTPELDSLKKAAKADSVLAELDSLPAGLVVTHTPNPVSAVEDSTAYYRYTWKYGTSVRSKSGPVTIVEFGVLNRSGGDWLFANYTGEPFTADQFAEWYGCDGAVVGEDEVCTDANNWTGAGCLGELTSLWYFIGEDAADRRVQGFAKINMEPKVVPASR